ncbi:8-oxo-dGTP pyrophosphatase MutT (NUDIX family) [Streptosporangium becharense]|uniref:8-oxo-dGTP pyrophosphatase MutT (NUDIX family) n=1 Tax=Streptosporangium becharense TaxID=1816182 RepID=A0A7W9IHS7_9ACTN|nr:NUDIX domain-containing protein [Streptosporangium becharense]MBB2914831.1 8-oxo-dGTP pyrophosphatase MutT (NUDIX family) [Streptosporangium becharense]MBB5820358.1 8-oxo-dGTP pyrophosphatase MutT (NUDIX family) [Streptosporangium becharense]
MLNVVAAAVIDQGRLLVVSKKVAPDVFYLPGGKPETGENPQETLVRELNEELGVAPRDMGLLGQVEDMAVLEGVPMRMTVFTVRLAGRPRPAAELAALGWTDGRDSYESRLAPAVRNQVLPLLVRAGALVLDDHGM